MTPPVLIRAVEPLSVQVDIADAMGVGLSIQALIKAGRIPSMSVEPFQRVADQLVSAARAAAVEAGR